MPGIVDTCGQTGSTTYVTESMGEQEDHLHYKQDVLSQLTPSLCFNQHAAHTGSTDKVCSVVMLAKQGLGNVSPERHGERSPYDATANVRRALAVTA